MNTELPEPEAAANEAEQDEQDSWVVRWILLCREEANQAKFSRMEQNRENRSVYHMRHSFAHKKAGQSKETLSMQPMAVEQNSSFFQQALIDMGDWWSVEAANPKNEAKMPITPKEVHAITKNQLEKAGMLRHVGLGVKASQLDSLVISKIHGCWDPVPAYVTKKNPRTGKVSLSRVKKHAWRLKLDLVSAKNYYPDPTGEGLYEVEDMWVDYHTLLEYSEGPYAIYDREAVENLPSGTEEDSEEKSDERNRGTQDEAPTSFRRRVKLTEYWGTILTEDGQILHENCVATVANDKVLIRRPQPNPNWYQESPYVAAGLFDIDEGVWPKALMDAATQHNITATEVYNLILDGGMKSVHGVGMLRKDWIENPEAASNGIAPGTTFLTNTQCPPGAKVYEMVQTGALPPDALQLFSIIQQEFNRSALTNEARTGATQLKMQQSATATVESSNAINSMFSGITKNIEQRWIEKVLRKSWMTCAQCLDEMDAEELKSVLPEDRAEQILAMSPEEIFAATAQGIRFKVFGITLTLQRQQDFRKIATILQTIGSSPVLLEAFVKKYSFDKLLGEALKALGFDIQKIELDQAEQELTAGGGEALNPADPMAAQAAPNQMSQAQAPTTGSLADQLGAAAGPQAQGNAGFPPSRALTQ